MMFGNEQMIDLSADGLPSLLCRIRTDGDPINGDIS